MIEGLREKAATVRIAWLDNVRIIAVLAIVFGHVSSGVNQSLGTTVGYNWWVADFFQSSIGWCVQVFVMISGYLLLNPMKEESPEVFYKKRASKLVIPIAFWTVFFSLVVYIRSAVNGDPVSMVYLVKRIWFGDPYYHMWFFYMILGLYLATPFLRFIVRHTSQRQLALLSGGLLFFAMLDRTAGAYFGSSFSSVMQISFLYSSFFLAGYVICRTKRDPHWTISASVFIISIVLTVIGNYYSLRFDGQLFNYYFFNDFSVTSIPLSISAMFLLKKVKAPLLKSDFNLSLSNLTLGICFIHPVFLDLLSLAGIHAVSYNTLYSIPLVVIAVYSLSLMAVIAIKKTPVINRIV